MLNCLVGRKQRVGIARSFGFVSPEVLLCDEATSALDPEALPMVLGSLLKRLIKSFGINHCAYYPMKCRSFNEICDQVDRN